MEQKKMQVYFLKNICQDNIIFIFCFHFFVLKYFHSFKNVDNIDYIGVWENPFARIPFGINGLMKWEWLTRSYSVWFEGRHESISLCVCGYKSLTIAKSVIRWDWAAKNNNDQAYSCPRDWRLSGSWELNWMLSWNP